MITAVGGEAMIALMKLQVFIANSIQIDGKQKRIFPQVHVLLFSAKWGKEEKKLALLFPKSRQCLFQMQAVFTRR